MTEAQDINIKLFSFGHSFGVPKTVDLLYSVRHFPVPNVDNYQQYDGRHKRIQNELLNLVQYEDIIKTIIEQLMNFIHEHKKNSITLAIGCEQGRHRSVAIIERLADLLGTTYNVEVKHRDLQRTGYDKKKQRERTTNRDRKYNNHDEDN
ncbi:unnamed protein product [Rotaria sordida]|uniref:RapZ C-terminal domain-containing protein n=1 Tax=Rotaria sordida TaxID=392033 RepID=A0A813WC12_9BILA|nr:unnamed protein product [Rotaria sordida]CAF3526745.1 unnamed protein product [Rotaria sordida]